MDNLEPQPQSQPELAHLQAQYDSLRSLVISLLVLLIVISGTFTIYLFRQLRLARAEITAASQIVAEYNKNSAPLMTDFVKKLTDYSKTHPDFVPILTKYGLTEKPGASGAAPTGAAAHAVTTPPKK